MMEDQPKADIKPVEPSTESVDESKTLQEEPESSTSDNQQENTKQSISEVTGDSAVDSGITNENIDKEESGEQEDEEAHIEVDPAAIEKLTVGVLELFLPNLQKAKGSLNELLHNQEVLIETVQQENSKFTDSTAMKQLIDIMQDTRRYHHKLVNLKREMNALTEKSAKLKRRAVKIQQQKQKEELTRADQIERERERERMLTAKVAKPPKDQNQ